MPLVEVVALLVHDVRVDLEALRARFLQEVLHKRRDDLFLYLVDAYIQLGIHVKGFFSKKYNRFQREITQVVEFYVDDVENVAKVNVLYSRDLMGNETYNNPTSHLIDYLASQGVQMREDPFVPKDAVLQTSTENNPAENSQPSSVEVLDI